MQKRRAESDSEPTGLEGGAGGSQVQMGGQRFSTHPAVTVAPTGKLPTLWHWGWARALLQRVLPSLGVRFTPTSPAQSGRCPPHLHSRGRLFAVVVPWGAEARGLLQQELPGHLESLQDRGASVFQQL